MSDDVESNILEYEREFIEFVDGFDFTLSVGNKLLGKELAAEASIAIRERTVVEQQEASGAPLKPLNPKYKARKLKKHSVDKIGVLTGQMLSEESMRGKVTIEPTEVSIAYGTGTKPTRFATYGTITGKEPTDREKAEYFTDSGRPFFELDDAIEEKLREVAQEALDEYVEEKG